MKKFDNIWNEVLDDIKKSDKAKYHRGKSWEHCYLFFRKYKKFRSDAGLLDFAALHLGFFLASWGMLRGSSFLLQQDYKYYVPIVRILINPKYDRLWNVSYPKLGIWEEEKIIELLFDLKDALQRVIKKECRNCKGPTDLLMTKILMVTMGCAPAYDTYFKIGLKRIGIRYYSNFSKKSFKNLLGECKNKSGHLHEIYNISRHIKGTKLAYPPMKLLDLYCWLLGQ